MPLIHGMIMSRYYFKLICKRNQMTPTKIISQILATSASLQVLSMIECAVE